MLLPSCLILTCMILSLHLTYAQQQQQQQQPKDPFIWCEPTPSPFAIQGVPTGYLESKYPTIHSLCSMLDGVPVRNLGCVCASSGGAMYCHSRLADQKLWTTSHYDGIDRDGAVMGEIVSMPIYCVRNCDCNGATRRLQGGGRRRSWMAGDWG